MTLSMSIPILISNRLVGIIGMALSGSLWLVTTWRTIVHCLFCCRRRERQTLFIMLTPRLVFHALLWLAMTVETIAYADLARLLPLSQDRDMADKLGYILLQVFGRSVFEFLAFSVVTVMWFETAILARFQSRDQANGYLTCLPKALGVWVCLLLCISLIQALDILLAGRSNSDYQGSTSVVRSHLLVEGLSWGFHSGLATLCVAMTSKRIVYVSTWSQSGAMTRLRLLTKALLPMILCALCYAIRSIWLIQQFTTMPSSTPKHVRTGWWIGFVWIPTILPSTMLLYSARKQNLRPVGEGGDESYRSPLLPTPVPPAEAFISFQRFTEFGGDLLSPFTPRRGTGNYDDDDDTIDFMEDDCIVPSPDRNDSVFIPLTDGDHHDSVLLNLQCKS